MIGESFGQYSLIERLGEGGMGVVYKALDRDLRRFVALKLLPESEAGSRELTRRLLREAQTASALNNPHIVTIHHIGRRDQHDYIVMEFVDGRTLRAVLDQDQLSLAVRLEYATQIADGLAVAHAAGIVHRDLKPGNIMITPDGLVKILDFGLARQAPELDPDLISGAATVGEPLTQAGTAVGTPAYMSPEQAEGRPLDHRSDLFSLGTILYELFSGAQPFKGNTLASLVHQVVYEHPPALQTGDRSIPADLDAMVRRALAKQPQDRPGDAAEMAATLRQIRARISDATLSLRTPLPAASRRGSARPRIPRRHARLLLAGAAALAILAAALWLLPAVRERPATEQAQASWQAAPSATELVRRGTVLLSRHHDPSQVAAARDHFQRAVGQDQNHAGAYVGLADASWRMFRREREDTYLEQARQYAAHALALDPQLAAAHVVHALAQMDAGELDAAEAACRQALELDPLNARAHRVQGRLFKKRDLPQQAEAAYLRSLEIQPAEWEGHVLLGALHYGQGDYPAAAAAFQEAIRLAPDNPVGYRNLGAAEHMLGNFPAAAAALQSALQIQPDQILYGNLGTLYFFQGLYPQAAAAFEQAVALAPNDHTNWRNLGDAYRLLPARAEEAREAYLRAAQLARNDLADAPDNPVLRSELALYLARQGDAAAARDELAALLQMDAGDPEAHYTTILVCEGLGDREQALQALERALESGYSAAEIASDPELVDLRKDLRYHRLMAAHSR